MNKAQQEAIRVVIAREAEVERARELYDDATKTLNRRRSEWADATRKARELGVVLKLTS